MCAFVLAAALYFAKINALRHEFAGAAVNVSTK